MPLYDFSCSDCGRKSTLLQKISDSACCPHCGSQKMIKQFAPFAIHNGAQSGSTADAQASRQPSSSGHVHTAACAGGCGAGAKADALIKKYLD